MNNETSSEPSVEPETTLSVPARVRRRATLSAVEGSDPHPGEPPLTPRDTTENDDRLREGKPPHWG